MSEFMPKPPMETRWYAKPAGEGWLTLFLGPADWSDEQIAHPDFGDGLMRWPNSIVGLCGTHPDRVASMAHQLIEPFHERFPSMAEAVDVAELINSGKATS